MSDWRALAEHPWMVVLGWMVVVSLLTTTVPALALGVWRVLRPRTRALDQHRAATVALASAIVLTVAAGPVLLSTTTQAGSSAVAAAAPSPSTLARRPDSEGRPNPRSTVSRDVTPPGASGDGPTRVVAAVPPLVVGLIGAGWCFGVGLLTARLVHGVTAVTGLRRRATLIDDGQLREAFERLSATAGLEGTCLLLSAEVDAPVAVGVRQPAVILPLHLLDVLPSDGLVSILVHELAHVRRGDYAMNLTQAGAEVLLFHSPAVWWMGSRIREAREFHCDDVSADAAGDPARYVEALTLVARLGPLQHARPAVGMAGPRLVTRVRRLLEGEPTMTLPLARVSMLAAALVVALLALPKVHAVAAGEVSAHLLAAGRADSGVIPRGYPPRQEGSGLHLLGVSPTAAHACGTFEVQNLTSEAVAQIRFVGVLSFMPGATRPVVIRESSLLTQVISPGATAVVQVPLLDVVEARREAGGAHVQAYCAVREVVFANRATWAITTNPAATTGTEALGFRRWPALPRGLVGQSRVAVAAGLTLCLDENNAEYSPGAQVGIKDEPGKAARCTTEGQWIEVDARSGEPLTSPAPQAVALDVVVDGLPAIRLKSAAGAVGTVRLPGGRILGLVPTLAGNGDVSIALHDMTTAPHRLVGTRPLQPGVAARFEDGGMSLSVTRGAR